MLRWIATEELINATFEAQRLPEGWLEEERCLSFEADGLRSGRAAVLDIPLPAGRWLALRVEVEIEPLSGAALVCGDRTYSLVTDLTRGTHRTVFYGMTPLAEGRRPVADQPGPHHVVLEVGGGPMRVVVDGDEMVAADDQQPIPVGGPLHLEFWDDCLVHL